MTVIVESETEEVIEKSENECEDTTDCVTEEEATVSVEVPHNTIIATNSSERTKSKIKKLIYSEIKQSGLCPEKLY